LLTPIILNATFLNFNKGDNMNFKTIFSSAKTYAHAILVAAGTAFVSALITGLSAGAWPTTAQVEQDGLIALAAAIAYLGKLLLAGTSAPATTAAGK
jgi:hypothetical protein